MKRAILDEILQNKREEVRRSKKKRPLSSLQKEAARLPKRKNDFLASLKRAKGMAVIAEVKRRSPSKGLLTKNFDPVKIARAYEAGGASALSVLTDQKYFGGSPAILKKIKSACSLPVLRKDFILEDYQVYESRLMGAEAILLIARALSAAAMKRLYALAKKLQLEVLFEVHNAAEMKKVRGLGPRLVGINNRDLSNFHVDLGVTESLAGKVPARCLLVSESGIAVPADLARLRKYGVKAVLVGETLMKDKKPKDALKRLLGKTRG